MDGNLGKKWAYRGNTNFLRHNKKKREADDLQIPFTVSWLWVNHNRRIMYQKPRSTHGSEIGYTLLVFQKDSSVSCSLVPRPFCAIEWLREAWNRARQRIFPPSLSGDVTFDSAPRATRNEAGLVDILAVWLIYCFCSTERRLPWRNSRMWHWCFAVCTLCLHCTRFDTLCEVKVLLWSKNHFYFFFGFRNYVY